MKKKISGTTTPNATTVAIGGLKNARELYKMKSTRDFLLEGLLPRGVLAALVGTSDVGKSMLARDLALQIVLNKKTYLGHNLKPKNKRVLYVSTEDDPGEWAARLQTSVRDSKDVEKLDGLDIIFESGNSVLPTIKKYLTDREVDLVVLDVVSDLGVGNNNDTDVVRNFLNPFKELARKTNTCILFLHHVAKRTQGMDKDNTIGSQAWTSAPRSVIMITKESVEYGKSDFRFISLVKGNFAADDKKNKLIPIILDSNLHFDCAPLSMDLLTAYQAKGKKVKKTENPEIRKLVSEMVGNGENSGVIVAKAKEVFNVGKTVIYDLIKEIKAA